LIGENRIRKGIRATVDVTYEPNTEKHLDALVKEMHRFGFEAIELEE